MTRYKRVPRISLLPQQQPDRSFRFSIIVLICLFRLSARCIQFVQLALIYSTQTSLCQADYRTVYAVDEWGFGVRLPTGAAVVTNGKPSGAGWDTPSLQSNGYRGPSACRQSSRGMSLITDLNPVLRLRINGKIPPLSHSFSWRLAIFRSIKPEKLRTQITAPSAKRNSATVSSAPHPRTEVDPLAEALRCISNSKRRTKSRIQNNPAYNVTRTEPIEMILNFVCI